MTSLQPGRLSQQTPTPEELQYTMYGGPEGSMLSALHSFIDSEPQPFHYVSCWRDRSAADPLHSQIQRNWSALTLKTGCCFQSIPLGGRNQSNHVQTFSFELCWIWLENSAKPGVCVLQTIKGQSRGGNSGVNWPFMRFTVQLWMVEKGSYSFLFIYPLSFLLSVSVWVWECSRYSHCDMVLQQKWAVARINWLQRSMCPQYSPLHPCFSRSWPPRHDLPARVTDTHTHTCLRRSISSPVFRSAQ